MKSFSFKSILVLIPKLTHGIQEIIINPILFTLFMEDFFDETMLENQPLTQEQLRNMSDGPTLIFMMFVMFAMAIGACLTDPFKED